MCHSRSRQTKTVAAPNAMKRKGYSPQEEEMDAVVAIHNAVNERAWAEVRALLVAPRRPRFSPTAALLV